MRKNFGEYILEARKGVGIKQTDLADAYMGDTPHLTLEEHGAYMRLLMIHWLMLPNHIPDDEKRVARMLGTTPGRWRKLKKTICDGKLYSIRDGFFRQKGLEKEFETARTFRTRAIAETVN